MEFDPANVLLGAVVILLVTILIGGVFAVVFATWGRRTRAGEDWLIRDLDELHSRLEGMPRKSRGWTPRSVISNVFRLRSFTFSKRMSGFNRSVTSCSPCSPASRNCWGGSLARGLKVSDAVGGPSPSGECRMCRLAPGVLSVTR